MRPWPLSILGRKTASAKHQSVLARVFTESACTAFKFLGAFVLFDRMSWPCQARDIADSLLRLHIKKVFGRATKAIRASRSASILSRIHLLRLCS